jgi:hypothetical protein
MLRRVEVRDASTYIVVLDREEHETLRVLLQERLMRLLLLDCRGHIGLCRLVRLGLLEVGYANNGLVNVLVLLVLGREAQLLCRRVGHLESLNG